MNIRDDDDSVSAVALIMESEAAATVDEAEPLPGADVPPTNGETPAEAEAPVDEALEADEPAADEPEDDGPAESPNGQATE
jgi:hypothetical protein